jgi:hypothetical protein
LGYLGLAERKKQEDRESGRIYPHPLAVFEGLSYEE